MNSKLVETWEITGIMDGLSDEEKEVLANHLHEAFTLDIGDGSGMFFVGQEISEENTRIMLITLTQRVYRTHKVSFDINHLYENMVKSFNNLSSSLVEVAMVVPNPEMEFISLFGEMYNPVEKEIKIDPKKFIDRFKLR